MSCEITAKSSATAGDVQVARLGPRFGRMDLMSQLSLLAVERLNIAFERLSRERVAVCLAANAGSLSTDADYWRGRDSAGGPSPTLFTYTLPSAAIGEIAIRHRLTGPNICFVGNGDNLLSEAEDLIQRGEADACVCVVVNVVSDNLARLLQTPAAAEAQAFLLERGNATG